MAVLYYSICQYTQVSLYIPIQLPFKSHYQEDSPPIYACHCNRHFKIYSLLYDNHEVKKAVNIYIIIVEDCR